MEEIITKDNLDTYTQGLKGVLSSMGLEIDDKAGSSAVNAVGAKVDTVDGKCDLILTAVGSGSGDVDYSQFVTKEYLDYKFQPKLHIIPSSYYYNYNGVAQSRYIEQDSLGNYIYPKILTHNGKFDIGSNVTVFFNSSPFLLSPETYNPDYISGSRAFVIDKNFNMPAIAGRYYGFTISGTYYTTAGMYDFDDGEGNSGSYPYIQCIPGLTDVFVENMWLGYRKVINITPSELPIRNDVVVICEGEEFKHGDSFYFDRASLYNDSLLVPAISGYNYILAPTTSEIEVYCYNNTENVYSENIYSFYYNTNGNYYSQSPLSSIYFCSSSSYFEGKRKYGSALDMITLNTHRYGGTYDSASGVMNLKLISDDNYDKYIDGTDVLNTDQVFIKTPVFYYNPTSQYLSLYVDLTLQTVPEGDGWIKYGEDLISVFSSSSSQLSSFKDSVGDSLSISSWNSLKGQSPEGFDFLLPKDFQTLRILYHCLNESFSKLKLEKNFPTLYMIDTYLKYGTSYYSYEGKYSGSTLMQVATSSYKYVQFSGYLYYFDGLWLLPTVMNKRNSSASGYTNLSSNYASDLYFNYGNIFDNFSLTPGIAFPSTSAKARIKYTGPYTIID